MMPPTFAQWTDWVFTGPEPDWEQLWDSASDSKVNWQLDHSTTLFRAPAFLLDTYPEKALQTGFWRLPNSWDLGYLIWDQDIAWERRDACLRAMFFLFRDLFAKTPLKDTCFMWWDLLRNFRKAPDQRVLNTQLDVLTQILRLPNEDCQLAALHGLGHLDHKGREAVVARFLSRSDLTEEVRAFGTAAQLGKVL
jgi:hypothetical protein